MNASLLRTVSIGFALLIPLAAQESHLHWRNGDILPGSLDDGIGEKLSWSAPIFQEKLTVRTDALERVVFPELVPPAAGTFRIGTITGDVFSADLTGTDEDSLHFQSKRFGAVVVPRTAIYSLSRLVDPNLIFDGSLFKDWKVETEGPIKDLRYKVYRGDWRFGEAYPDFSKLRPISSGYLESGYLDITLSQLKREFAMSLTGEFTVAETGDYQVQFEVDDMARLFIDEKEVARARVHLEDDPAKVTLKKGAHSLRVDFVDYGGDSHLSIRLASSSGKIYALSGKNYDGGWGSGNAGNPQTGKRRAGLFQPIEFPDSYQLDLELSSSTSPRFLLGFGPDKRKAQAEAALRFETWDNELVAVQGNNFEPVLTLGKGQRDVRLRLLFDGKNESLLILDAGGQVLTTLKGIAVPSGKSGIDLRNRGNDLVLQRLTVAKVVAHHSQKETDLNKHHVLLNDGHTLNGTFHLENGKAFVLGPDRTKTEIPLHAVARVVSPEAKLRSPAVATVLNYPDGESIRGKLRQSSSDQATLQTDFCPKPVICRLPGASSLVFPPSTAAIKAVKNPDQLITGSGRLRGGIVFGSPKAPLNWTLVGESEPVPLSPQGSARLERREHFDHGRQTFELIDFPCTLHLKNGERLPCRVLEGSKTSLNIRSPFLEQNRIDAAYVKAIEFPSTINTVELERAKLERALIVPRVYRNAPPSHLLLAHTGDLMRGRLHAITADTVQFQSKLRRVIVPVDRLQRIVDISEPTKNTPKESATDLAGNVKVVLIDDCVIIFKPTAFENGQLMGTSDLYGEVRVPVHRISEITFGSAESNKQRTFYQSWITTPAPEPDFGG